MKKLFDIITYLSALAFVLALSSIDSALEAGSIMPFVVMLFCGAWIVGYVWSWEENRRLNEGW